jgi:hypothetical protein
MVALSPAAFILALLGGIPRATVFAGFPTKLFLTILGTMYFFCLLQENKTLELLSQKSRQPFPETSFLDSRGHLFCQLYS